MMYRHFADLPSALWHWPNFSPAEFACPCCGELFYDEWFFHRLQIARSLAGTPFHINSGHRCAIYNANPRIGGAPLSAHKRVAADISTRNMDRFNLLQILKESGLTTFGLYASFIHTDPRPGRRWYGNRGAKKLWTGPHS